MNKTMVMSKKKRVDLGEYIVDIFYDEKTGEIEVSVLDELGDVIESISITNENNEDVDPRLN
jgi:hypothetical protein